MSELELTPRQSFPVGAFCWADLGTSDQEGAKQFYTDLFGWSVFDAPMGDGSFYSMLRHGGQDVAALYQQAPQDAPPSWLSYVNVDKVDHSVEQARSLGAAVLMGPFDVMQAGRMAFIRDPAGAMIALWEGREHLGAGVINQPGGLCWFELMTTDAERSQAFYTSLFGWSASPMEIDGAAYTVFSCGEQPAAGMMQLSEAAGEVPSHWLSYFWVEDCDAIAERTRDLGGQILSAPADVPGIGRYAVLQDPQGATFCVIAMAAPAA